MSIRRKKRRSGFDRFKAASGGVSLVAGLSAIPALLLRQRALANLLMKVGGVAGLASLTPSATSLKRAVSSRKFSQKERATILSKVAEGAFNATFLSSRTPPLVSVTAAAGFLAAQRRSERLSRSRSRPRSRSRW